MGADCAGDASIQHSISNGIIISIKPFKFSAEDRPFSALSITLARDLNKKSKKKKDKDHFKNRLDNTTFLLSELTGKITFNTLNVCLLSC